MQPRRYAIRGDAFAAAWFTILHTYFGSRLSIKARVISGPIAARGRAVCGKYTQ
jgi:hypothetical protein